MARWRAEAGQASVEFLALVPLLVVLALAAWQGVVTAHAAWMAGAAAREAARARAVGADPRAAARRLLGGGALAHGLRVADDGDGVRVRIVVPAVVGGWRLGAVGARARMEPQA